MTYRLENMSFAGVTQSVLFRDNPDGSTTSVPTDPANADYQEYLEWVAEGNTPQPANQPDAWQAIRLKRDELIRESDWTMIPGCTVDQAQWAAYRQTLRDIPTTYAETGPESVVWPRKPSTSGPNTIDE